MVLPWLRQYVTRFFGLLRERLGDAGVEFELIYATPSGTAGGRGDTAQLDWAQHVERRELRLGRYSIAWQPYLRIIRDADLVVVQQATRDVLNYLLLAHQALGGPRVAFWGHGRSFLATSGLQRASERVKALLTRQSHWFFAYNDLTADVLVEKGYPVDRITVIDNSIDTLSLEMARRRVTTEDRLKLMEGLGLVGRNVGIYCGAMYEEKRLPFLVEAATEIRKIVPDFELICVGGGVRSDVISHAADRYSWVHYVGPKFGEDLARCFSLAQVFLLPGAVGLAVQDSFVFRTPLITTSAGLHGPEIAYLESGTNGIIVEGDGSRGSYASAVASVLSDKDLHGRLVEGCIASADLYSVESMAARFAGGVLDALEAPARR